EGEAYVSMRPFSLHVIGSKKVRRGAAPQRGVTPYTLFHIEQSRYTVTGTGNLCLQRRYGLNSAWKYLIILNPNGLAASGMCNRLPISVAFLPLNRWLMPGCEILQQHTVYEDAPTTRRKVRVVASARKCTYIVVLG